MKKSLVFFIFLLFVVFVKSDVYVGTTDGYIVNTDSQLVAGASVTVSINGCNTGEGCSQVTTSDLGGYYVVANLNLPSNGIVTVGANKGEAFGSNAGVANQFQAATVNVTICEAPSEPALDPIFDTHLSNVIAKWSSGIDPRGYNIFDLYKLDSNPEERIDSPKNEADLSYTEHTWKVRTCNNFCCSNWVSDTFRIINAAPSKPVLNVQEDTNTNSVVLSWVPGVDHDGDDTFDEYNFSLRSSILSPALSPQTEANLAGGYTWKVRTCEKYVEGLCSDWADDSFVVCTSFAPTNCPACPTCSSSSSSSGRSSDKSCKLPSIEPVVCEKPLLYLTPPVNTISISPVLVLTIPEIVRKKEFEIKTAFSTHINLENLVFSVDSPKGFDIEEYKLSDLGAFNKSRFVLLGKNNVKNGVYDLTFNVILDNEKIISEPFQLKVKKINHWLYILLGILIMALILIYLYYKQKKL
ncbi:carboxypeptidase regulatory-like domain-containing protein [Candidatus Woesearchaeota archaeon]|nr:carboxypeptidase regulatory-like domain-containing protein [Candidatus Woesearchaeota archaeon]